MASLANELRTLQSLYAGITTGVIAIRRFLPAIMAVPADCLALLSSYQLLPNPNLGVRMVDIDVSIDHFQQRFFTGRHARCQCRYSILGWGFGALQTLKDEFGIMQLQLTLVQTDKAKADLQKLLPPVSCLKQAGVFLHKAGVELDQQMRGDNKAVGRKTSIPGHLVDSYNLKSLKDSTLQEAWSLRG